MKRNIQKQISILPKVNINVAMPENPYRDYCEAILNNEKREREFRFQFIAVIALLAAICILAAICFCMSIFEMA